MHLRQGLIYLGLATLSFSTMELVGKMVSTSLHPFQITFLRFFIGSLALLPLAVIQLKRRGIRLGWPDLKYFAGLGILCIVICMGFFQTAILYTQASTVAVIFSTNPIFTVPFAYFLLKEPFDRYTLLSLVLGLLGVVVIALPYLDFSSVDFRGILLAFTAAIIWSLYSVLGKKGIARYGGIIQNCFSFLLGNIVLLIILLGADFPIFSGINQSNFWPVIYLGIFVSGLGFFFYFQGMALTSASMGSLVFFIKPALAAVLAGAILGESIGPQLMIGIALIIAGSVSMFFHRSKISRG